MTASESFSISRTIVSTSAEKYLCAQIAGTATIRLNETPHTAEAISLANGAKLFPSAECHHRKVCVMRTLAESMPTRGALHPIAPSVQSRRLISADLMTTTRCHSCIDGFIVSESGPSALVLLRTNACTAN